MTSGELVTACHTLQLRPLNVRAVPAILDGNLLGVLCDLIYKSAMHRSWRGAPQTSPVQRPLPLQPRGTLFCASQGRRLPRWDLGLCACWCATRGASLQTSSCEPPLRSQAASAARCVIPPTLPHLMWRIC